MIEEEVTKIYNMFEHDPKALVMTHDDTLKHEMTNTCHICRGLFMITAIKLKIIAIQLVNLVELHTIIAI
jgi:hypothetical protein